MSPKIHSIPSDPFLHGIALRQGKGIVLDEGGPAIADAIAITRPIFIQIRDADDRAVHDGPESDAVAQTRPMNALLARPFPRWKRLLDIAGALVGILLFGPVMIAIALAIKLTSPGPALFRQQRGGLGGRPFTVYKFRTMCVDAEAKKAALLRFNERQGPAFKMKHDPRITPIGRILRKTSLDELPQFFNVLEGDMSLVGPRPLPVEENRQCERWHHARLDVKPGITGIWQITSRDESCFDRWVRLDMQYIRALSFWTDLKLLFMTVPAVLSRKGAH
ncbi:MAG TPA: exopolysaccharide biosynthesis polyprenyl glycosylphosphotransferase [Candidatus Hydrogenedentes bacterium]|nr:exopolysaccharide biosynthesis polyprenyl glycosylphosphotransferase [Candidatus Hydrogenedentota bacterium]